MLTQRIVAHVASGEAHFSGAGLILLSVALAAWPRGNPVIGRRCRDLALSLGAVLVVLSATPFPAWFHALLTIVSIAWYLVESYPVHKSTRVAWRCGMGAAWLAAIAWELPYHFCPPLPVLSQPRLGVIGDSVTAGMGDRDEVTWPRLLAESRRIPVDDVSQMGATVASALKQARQLSAADTLVVLEIGGNDLLGGTQVDKFETGLDALLREVSRPGRTVLLMELPLPPFYNRFGQVQRRLAARHGVLLIPKSVFLDVLTDDAATLDSIHLSPAGHRKMSGLVWDVIAPAYSRARE